MGAGIIWRCLHSLLVVDIICQLASQQGLSVGAATYGLPTWPELPHSMVASRQLGFNGGPGFQGGVYQLTKGKGTALYDLASEFTPHHFCYLLLVTGQSQALCSHQIQEEGIRLHLDGGVASFRGAYGGGNALWSLQDNIICHPSSHPVLTTTQ